MATFGTRLSSYVLSGGSRKSTDTKIRVITLPITGADETEFNQWEAEIIRASSESGLTLNKEPISRAITHYR